jgi:hypothetical protein
MENFLTSFSNKTLPHTVSGENIAEERLVDFFELITRMENIHKTRKLYWKMQRVSVILFLLKGTYFWNALQDLSFD